jgi:tellurite resistance protein
VVFLGLGFHFRVTGRGSLHCQRCGGDRQYRQCAGRRWIHVFFLPLIPLDRITEHVQCTSCGTRYRNEVLALPTTAQMRAVLPAATRLAAAAMIRAGDAVSGQARACAIDTIRKAGATRYGDADLDTDLDRDADPSAALGRLALQLTMPAHEWFLAGIIRIGLSDGQLSADERAVAKQLAACLGMTPAQAHGVILMTEESAAAG